MTTIAIDMSLRSTAIVRIDKNDKLLNFKIIKTEKDQFIDNEELINYVTENIYNFIEISDKIIVIEGLSLNSKSAKKDLIAGMYWSIRCMIYNEYSYILLGSVPVLSWRKHFVEKEKLKNAKKTCGKARGLKDVVFSSCPDDIQKKFLLYIEKFIEENNYRFKDNLKIDMVYDLADAYGLAIYRNSLK